MGAVISRAAGGLGTLLGHSFIAPFKAILGKSCQGICPGTWELICFIENLCFSDLMRFLMVLLLTYITLLFVYLLFKVGIIQCIGRNLCKMTWAACKTYWIAMEDITCFLWHKINHSNRNHRQKFKYLEEGFSTTTSSNEDEDGDYLDNYKRVRVMRRGRRRRRSMREKRREEMQRSLYQIRHSFKGKRNHVRMNIRNGNDNNSLVLFKRRRIR